MFFPPLNQEKYTSFSPCYRSKKIYKKNRGLRPLPIFLIRSEGSWVTTDSGVSLLPSSHTAERGLSVNGADMDLSSLYFDQQWICRWNANLPCKRAL